MMMTGIDRLLVISPNWLGDAVMAHATTNGLLTVYALATGNWSSWS